MATARDNSLTPDRRFWSNSLFQYKCEMSVTVPEGLSELLEEFAVTVLREKPKDLVEFAASYFNELNMSRKQGGSSVSEQASTAEMEMTIEGIVID